jgi:2-polyprenyl-3-methyl-5-hydroxy-6-metoxy-1,4-benzoquinol methylase
MTGAEDSLYDDAAFFERYQDMRQRGAGLNEELERPAIIRLLPDVADADVLDIGCGDGALGRWLADQGARHVLCTDPSARMLALAAGHAHQQVRYRRASAESLALAPGSRGHQAPSNAGHADRRRPRGRADPHRYRRALPR